jgi:hypothetical protein
MDVLCRSAPVAGHTEVGYLGSMLIRPTLLARVLSLACAIGSYACGGSAGGPPPPPPTPTEPPLETVWDVDARGVPRLATVDYIDLSKIRRISFFRSSVGHNYSDELESCRSMKHYFMPRNAATAPTIEIRAPFSGKVTRTFEEWAGTQVQIQSSVTPAFIVVLFHVALSQPLAEGQTLAAGDILGTHVGNQTFSDVAVSVTTPQGRRLVSYFELISDDIWAGYAARGAASRQTFILTREQRDADPLLCNGEVFAKPGGLPQWVDLL